LNAHAERWVRSVKEECLSKVILFGERSLRRALNEYVEHYHAERNHQGKGNVLLFPRDTDTRPEQQPVPCRERLGDRMKVSRGLMSFAILSTTFSMLSRVASLSSTGVTIMSC
jgi:Integrase core domain